MPIIVSENGSNAEKIDQSHFGLEGRLQEYVKNNPDIVPIYEISEDARLLILAREYSTNSGPIDALGVDQDGNIYVVETKLYKNSDKRTVLAQALDYGASLWRHSGEAANFIDILSVKVFNTFGVSLLEKLQEFFEIEDGQFLVETIARNVQSGNIKFVILMDKVDDRLKDLVTYVNQNSRFDIYAVDLEYYKHKEFEIIIPKLYGSEVKKVVTAYDDISRFDNQKVREWIDELELSYVAIDQDSSTKTYIRLRTKFLDELIPPRNDKKSGWKNGSAYLYEIRTDGSGIVRVQLALNSTAVSEAQSNGQKQLIKYVDRNPKKLDWIWFIAASWKVDYKSGESVLKKEIQSVFTEGIPEFEAGLKAFTESQVS